MEWFFFLFRDEGAVQSTWLDLTARSNGECPDASEWSSRKLDVTSGSLPIARATTPLTRYGVFLLLFRFSVTNSTVISQ